METMAIRVFSVFLLLAIGGIRLTLTARLSLQNVTQKVGENAVIECRFESLSNTDQLYWNRYNIQATNIYDPRKPNDLKSEKYSTGNGSSSLTVKNVQLDDAATYCCAVDPANDYCANLVVIGSLEALMYPSDGVDIGQAVNLTCSLTYNSPTKDDNALFPLSDDQDPQLVMIIGNDEIANSMNGKNGEEVVGTTTVPHSKTLSVNRTIVATDAGGQLECKVSSKNPQVDYSTQSDLKVFMATTETEIFYPGNEKNPNNHYPINSSFVCSGNGYPVPTAEWFNGQNKSISDPKEGNSTWTPKTIGTYSVRCSAKYQKSPNPVYSEVIQVTVGDGPNSNASKTDNKVGLGVGLGIGLGVPVLVGIIVLIVILSRRKKTSGPYPVKQPETKTKSPSTGKAPNGKNSDPSPGPRNNVNPNPNPTYTTPVMPEQTGNSPARKIGDSPGYGDLGVKQIGGSGSNPHLNESFDSKANASFDSSRNYPPNGNFVIKPGRTNPSNSAPNTSV